MAVKEAEVAKKRSSRIAISSRENGKGSNYFQSSELLNCTLPDHGQSAMNTVGDICPERRNRPVSTQNSHNEDANAPHIACGEGMLSMGNR